MRPASARRKAFKPDLPRICLTERPAQVPEGESARGEQRPLDSFRPAKRTTRAVESVFLFCFHQREDDIGTALSGRPSRRPSAPGSPRTKILPIGPRINRPVCWTRSFNKTRRSRDSRRSFVLFYARGRRPHHCADSWLTAFVGEQGANQCVAIEFVGLRTPPPTRRGNRRWIDDVAFDTVLCQHSMDPEPLEPGLLNDGFGIANRLLSEANHIAQLRSSDSS